LAIEDNKIIFGKVDRVMADSTQEAPDMVTRDMVIEKEYPDMVSDELQGMS
jgi:hypothetical protein